MAVCKRCESEFPDAELLEVEGVDGVYCGPCATVIEHEDDEEPDEEEGEEE